MPLSSRRAVDDQPPGNRKVMIYVAPDLHREMRLVALDEERSASDVYCEAARAYLKSRGVKIGQRHGKPGAKEAATTVELAEAIDRQGRRIEDLHAAVAAAAGSPHRDAHEPAGAKAAEAMKVVLAQLKVAGAKGVDSRDLAAATHAAGVSSGAAESANTVLRTAGLVRFDNKRWYVD